MMENKQHLRTAVIMILLALGMTGCASRSPSPRFYVLGPHDGWRSVTESQSATDSAFTVRFAPIRLPAYLDRPSIVTRISANQIRVHDFDRWGIPLDELIQELLVHRTATLLPTAYVEHSARMQWPGDGYRVLVDIVRMDGSLGGTVNLIAQWQVARIGGDQEMLAQKVTIHQTTTDGRDPNHYVNAVRAVVQQLGRAIAQVIADDHAPEHAEPEPEPETGSTGE